MKLIQFKAKDLKTNEWVYGDLAYVSMLNSDTKKVYIVSHKAVGGMLYITKRHRIDTNTLEILIH